MENEAFLKSMERKAQRLARQMDNPDHWAKPFYSDVHLFRPGVTRAFIGVNGAGDSHSHDLDKAQKNHLKVWSGDVPLHNAFLDEAWGSQKKAQAHRLQRAVREVFEAIYGKQGERKLRETPCFNLIPVSAGNLKDIASIEAAGIQWGIEMLEFLKPKFLIVMGQAGQYVRGYQETARRPFRYSEKSGEYLAKVRMGRVSSGSMAGTKVLWLPHLSNFGGQDLCDELRAMRPFP